MKKIDFLVQEKISQAYVGVNTDYLEAIRKGIKPSICSLNAFLECMCACVFSCYICSFMSFHVISCHFMLCPDCS